MKTVKNLLLEYAQYVKGNSSVRLMGVRKKHGDCGYVKSTIKKGVKMKKDIKRLEVAIYAIVAYLVVSGVAIAASISGISEQLRNII